MFKANINYRKYIINIKYSNNIFLQLIYIFRMYTNKEQNGGKLMWKEKDQMF